LAQLQYHDVAVFEHYQCTSASWASTAILPCLSDHIHVHSCGGKRFEPPRLSRRLQPWRGWEHEHREAVLT
jgi:hypothetical protein